MSEDDRKQVQSPWERNIDLLREACGRYAPAVPESTIELVALRLTLFEARQARLDIWGRIPPPKVWETWLA